MPHTLETSDPLVTYRSKKLSPRVSPTTAKSVNPLSEVCSDAQVPSQLCFPHTITHKQHTVFVQLSQPGVCLLPKSRIQQPGHSLMQQKLCSFAKSKVSSYLGRQETCHLASGLTGLLTLYKLCILSANSVRVYMTKVSLGRAEE